MIKDLLIVADAVGEAAGPYALSLAREVGAAAGCLYLQPEGGDEAPGGAALWLRPLGP